ncbi:hypothetical protein AKJ09_07380 [Labilithrix luteola]|uniref:tRNA (pseudouridine(54)-N(1))-methyltransferase n=1 Tax=Labilithrix luteola TaxID=1391654 RepID=A0A0K1Q4Z0_9BACT|nr:tRNA (pseudouridine(54)-N(1))-methyltransferase TrmY [Labilithrix luteola]AKV00717.1 hypothetical protein AKJ09_07380 [Labilithrix luteola]
MRRFVVVGQKALASPDFSLNDLPGTSGRLDVLARCMRAALLVSHGLRTDTILYLVLLGGPEAPRALRFDGSAVKFLRPDERALATLVQKSLVLARQTEHTEGFATVKPGIAVVRGGLEAALDDLPSNATLYLLESAGTDVRDVVLEREPVFVLGDHLGLDAPARALLGTRGAVGLSLGPRDIHAEDAIAVVSNELDRGFD